MCAPGRLAFYIAPYLQCLADVIPRLVQWPETGDVGHRRMAEMEPDRVGFWILQRVERIRAGAGEVVICDVSSYVSDQSQ